MTAAKRAEELFTLLEETERRFYERLIELCRERIEISEEAVKDRFSPMTEQQAIKFEAMEMEFGKYRGQQIGIIDPEYLCWLSEDNRFMDQLKRYLKSERFQRRMKE